MQTQQTEYQRLSALATQANNKGCGLDVNIYGQYTLGFYVGRHYYQFQRKTAEQIRRLAVRLGFINILDRLPPKMTCRKRKCLRRHYT